MSDFLDLLLDFFGDLISLLSSTQIMPGLSLWSIFLGLIFVGAVINVFWRGAKG